jgi:hypothetical protein
MRMPILYSQAFDVDAACMLFYNFIDSRLSQQSLLIFSNKKGRVAKRFFENEKRRAFFLRK